MMDVKRIVPLCLFGLSLALFVGGIAWLGSGADEVGPGASLGQPLVFLEHALLSPGFPPLLFIVASVLLIAFFAYPWRPPPDVPVLTARPAEADVWPPAPTGPVLESPKTPAHHWARPDADEE